MTSFERFEREIPQLMDELSPLRLPDYVDDMLRQTARTPQRPAWSSLERWLPLGVIARPRPIPTIPLRPILVVLLVALLAAAAAMVVGSPRRLPAPFGPARNGLILFESTDGGVHAFDPTSGSITKLQLGPGVPAAPLFTNDGTRFAYDLSSTSSNGLRALFIAKADGSDARQLAAPARAITWSDWSPNGDRMFVMREDDPVGEITVIDTATGTSSPLRLDLDVAAFAARPGTQQLILSSGTTLYRMNDDGTDVQPIITADGLLAEQFSVSPDGRSVVYPTWTDAAQGRLHIVDIDSGIEQDHDFYSHRTYMDLDPAFSPDGRSLMVERYDDAGNYRPTIVPLDGGAPMSFGRSHPPMTNGSLKSFSPDGTRVLVTYQDDGTSWLYDVASGNGEQLDLPVSIGTSPTWQRLAP